MEEKIFSSIYFWRGAGSLWDTYLDYLLRGVYGEVGDTFIVLRRCIHYSVLQVVEVGNQGTTSCPVQQCSNIPLI